MNYLQPLPDDSVTHSHNAASAKLNLQRINWFFEI